MPEKEATNPDLWAEKPEHNLKEEFLELLAAGEVHQAREIIKNAIEQEDKDFDIMGKEFKEAAQKAVEDSLRKGHVRHAERLLGFATDYKISVDLSLPEIPQALSEGFELCGPRKKEEILHFAKQNKIEINT
jgi:hypothetical protein